MEEAVKVFAHKASVVDRFPTDIVNVGLGADDANVVLMRLQLVQSNVLAYKHPYADTGHVEAIEKDTDIGIDGGFRPLRFLVLEHTLRYRRDDRIVSLLDVCETLCEAFVVVVHFRRPRYVLQIGKVAECINA